MGLLSAATVSEALKFCIFDLRRGQHEGEELDKILFFYPADLPFTAQLSVTGLSEGLITFTRMFSSETACEVIEADLHSHVFYEAEPDIWMVMVVEKSKDTESVWRIDALRRVQKEVHSLFMMFNGSIRALLDKEPSGEILRTHLYSFIMDYLSDFFVGKKIQLPNFRDSLKERGTVHMLTVGREAAIEVQSLVKSVESCGGGSTPCYSLVLFQDLLVSSTLAPVDTINLFTYANLRLTPRAISSKVSSWSYLRKGNSAAAAAAASSTGLNIGNSSSSSVSVRPLQHGKWARGIDGFLVTHLWGSDVTPTIWLQETGEKMFVCAYQHKSLTFILLLPASFILNTEQGTSLLKQEILENGAAKMVKVEEKLSKGWAGENAYHVGGYRYLLVDGDRDVSRASPPGKVTTLAKESLLGLSKVREEVDLDKSRWKRDDVSGHEKDLEVCIRTKNNAWVIARVSRGKELYMVLEKANETLLYASDAVEKFSNRYCNGAFSLD